MKKNDKLEKIKILLLFCIVIVISTIIIITSLKNIGFKKEISDEQLDVNVESKIEEENKATEQGVIISKLSEMTERDRIEYYFSKFIENIENKNYENAYEMLYDEYKKNYFPNLVDFEEYAKKTFPKMMSIDHTNFERSGNTYILFINMNDSLSGNKNSSKEMKFVIREDGLNEFVMSFSVI